MPLPERWSCGHEPDWADGLCAGCHEDDQRRHDEAIALLREFNSPDGFCGEVPWELRDRLEAFLATVDRGYR